MNLFVSIVRLALHAYCMTVDLSRRPWERGDNGGMRYSTCESIRWTGLQLRCIWKRHRCRLHETLNMLKIVGKVEAVRYRTVVPSSIFK